MRVAISSVDDVIHIDGNAMRTDCAALRAREISAVQWYGEAGEIEYIGHKRPNEKIEDFEPFHAFVAQAEPFQEPEPMTPDESRAHWEAYLARHPDLKAALEKEQAERDAIVAEAMKALPPPG
jgi:hypothetical protein